MTDSWHRKASFEVGLWVKCGTTSHPVTLEVAPWSVRTLFNPCDVLPPAARELSGSRCARAVGERLQTTTWAVNGQWLDRERLLACCLTLAEEVDPDILNHVLFIHESKARIAQSILMADDQPLTWTRVETALLSDNMQQRWAALVCLAEAQDPLWRARAQSLWPCAHEWPVLLRLGLLAVTRPDATDERVQLLMATVSQGDVSSFQRIALVAELAEFGEIQHASSLLQIVSRHEREAELLEAAVSGLRQIIDRYPDPPEARDELVTLVSDVLLASVRCPTLGSFFDRCSERVLGALLQLTTESGTPEQQRRLAILALSHVPVQRSGPVLLELHGKFPNDLDETRPIETSLCRVLHGIHAYDDAAMQFLSEAVQQFDDDLLPEVFEKLCASGMAQAAPVILDKLSSIVSARVRIAGLETIGRIGDASIVGSLMDHHDMAPNAPMRTVVADSVMSILGRTTARDLHPNVLQRTLHCDDPAVASASARLLARHSEASATKILVRALSSDLAADSMTQVLAALQVRADLRALVPVVRFLEVCRDELLEPATATACGLLQVLSQEPTPVNYRSLHIALASTSLPVARAAACLLRERPDKRFCRQLMLACLRCDVRLSAHAGAALRPWVKPSQVTRMLKYLTDGDGLVAQSIEAAVVAIGDVAIAPLVKTTHESYAPARMWAVRVLGAIGGHEAEAALALACDDVDERVRLAARRLTGHIVS